jgi:ABC-2 type transport system permease protein
VSAPPPPPADARIVDLRFTPVTSRGGTATAVVALARHALRRVLGLRRTFRHKLLILIVLAIAYIPTVGFLAFLALAPEDIGELVVPPPAAFYANISTAVLLFVALAAPQTLCPDRRHRTLGLFLASALDRTTYLAANALALAAVLVLVTLGPALLLQLGAAVLGIPGPAVAVVILRAVASSLVLILLYTGLGLAGAALTDRRAFASAAIFLVLFGANIVITGSRVALDLPAAVGMLDITALALELVARINGGTAAIAGADVVTLVAGGCAWVAALTGITWLRYRTLAVVR